MEMINHMVSNKQAVIFTKSTCCMCHSIKSLLYTYGVDLIVFELDEMSSGKQEIERALSRLGSNPVVPAVFINGRFAGGAQKILTLHLTNSITPMLIRLSAAL